ncbi:thioredoxin [Petropleomorpha daqingensis]|uniref:Thioredoxin n=1 Tax=Petropleomorpha daqingensis TaxID=2026353 RepID=A0A853CM09_9ACTN|nr:thioredoxin [Petropleomorpha daqingensis]NYJ08607.1 thioredoxin 1 [Petropleomorpha daqingensis]
MSSTALTAGTFETTVTDNDIVLVDFWADWCGPCKRFAPVFEAASEVHPDIVFAKVDTEAEQGLSAAANIRSIPTLMAFRQGILVFNQAGALPAPALEQLIEGVRSLDMDKVREQLAEQKAQSA